MTTTEARDPQAWDEFLKKQRFSPFLQSWTMGEVYKAIGQEPVRLEMRDNGSITAICFAHVVPARRGRHLSVPYGPIVTSSDQIQPMLEGLKHIAQSYRCAFIRMSPFQSAETSMPIPSAKRSPLHLLAEHIWYLPLTTGDTWQGEEPGPHKTPDELQSAMRSTARNLIRRATKDGVTITLSPDPIADLHHFITLHDETRKRHGFTPYTNSFFKAQVEKFTASKQVLLYLAHYQHQVIASSIHMTFGGETSYHHGASTAVFRKIPASYLLQWTAITDALSRGDTIYNFWGIAPVERVENEWKIQNEKHPFAGVTLFKTGFGGNLLSLQHCIDIPLRASYLLTRGFEMARKWKRGF